MLSNNDITNLQKNHADYERIGKKADGGFWSKNGTVQEVSNALNAVSSFKNTGNSVGRLSNLIALVTSLFG